MRLSSGLALAAITPVVAFSLHPTGPGTDLSNLLRWSKPLNNLTQASGLGRGITYAFEEGFCGSAMPAFTERAFLSCDDIEDATRRALDTWAVNQPDLYFQDVTAEPEGLTGRAELMISVRSTVHGDQPVIAERVAGGPVGSTSGAVVTRDNAIQRARIVLNVGNCLYLDPFYCHHMHRFDMESNGALLLLVMVLTPIFACSVVPICVSLCCGMHRMCGRHKDGEIARLGAAMRAVSEPILLLWLLFVIVIACPYFYFYVARPCIVCHDYETLIVHGTGHALGLSDPTMLNNANYALVAPINASNCDGDALLLPPDPASLLQVVPYVPLAPQANFMPASVMEMPTTTWSRRCPSQDDLDGLSLLYPTCNDTASTTFVFEPGTDQPDFTQYSSEFNTIRIEVSSSSDICIDAVAITGSSCFSPSPERFRSARAFRRVLPLPFVRAKCGSSRTFSAAAIWRRLEKRQSSCLTRRAGLLGSAIRR